MAHRVARVTSEKLNKDCCAIIGVNVQVHDGKTLCTRLLSDAHHTCCS